MFLRCQLEALLSAMREGVIVRSLAGQGEILVAKAGARTIDRTLLYRALNAESHKPVGFLESRDGARRLGPEGAIIPRAMVKPAIKVNIDAGQSSPKVVGWREIGYYLICDANLARRASEHFKAEYALRGYGRGRAPVVSVDVLETFRQLYVSFDELNERWPGGRADLHRALNRKGVRRVVFKPSKASWRNTPSYSAFYARAEAEGALLGQ